MTCDWSPSRFVDITPAPVPMCELVPIEYGGEG